jgi:hypothetical protein
MIGGNTMKNIFKIFKENQALREENKLLQAQIEALSTFKENFDKFYHDVTNVHYVKIDRKQVRLQSLSLIEDCIPTEYIKEHITMDFAKQLEPFIKYDLQDDYTSERKSLVAWIDILR